MIKTKIWIIGIVLILFISANLSTVSATPDIEVNNIHAYYHDGYYVVRCNITPNRDISHIWASGMVR